MLMIKTILRRSPAYANMSTQFEYRSSERCNFLLSLAWEKSQRESNP